MDLYKFTSWALLGVIAFQTVFFTVCCYERDKYKVERDLSRQQVIAFNTQLNIALAANRQEEELRKKQQQDAFIQREQYLKSIQDIAHANLSGDCQQAIGFLVDESKKLH